MVWAKHGPRRITMMEQSVSSTATRTPCLPVLECPGKRETTIGPVDRGEQQSGPDLAGGRAGSHFRRVAMQCKCGQAGEKQSERSKRERHETKRKRKERDANKKERKAK